MNNIATFSLNNFVGSLDFLIHLIDRDEVRPAEVEVYSLSEQFSDKMPVPIDIAAEWVYGIAYLTWLKSKALLPVHEQATQIEDEIDPHFEIIHHLVDYCHFKEVAKELSIRHEDQSGHFLRGLPLLENLQKKSLEPLSIDQLQAIIQEVIKKSTVNNIVVKEETWRVSDKIIELRALLKNQSSLYFDAVFNSSKLRIELIVTFLALLELMKNGELIIGYVEGETGIVIMSNYE